MVEEALHKLRILIAPTDKPFLETIHRQEVIAEESHVATSGTSQHVAMTEQSVQPRGMQHHKSPAQSTGPERHVRILLGDVPACGLFA